MKIRAIRVAEVGPFSSAVALEHFSGGFDVLTGANETGKSTLFAALATLFAEKHTSVHKSVAALRPDRGGAPLIEADLEIDGRLWRLRKRFLSQRMAELSDLCSGEIWRGADAEERAGELLGASAAMRGFVWVPQGSSFDLPDVRKEKDKAVAAIVTGLSALIEQEAADAAGAGVSRRIASEIDARLAEFVTAAHGKAKVGGALYIAQRRRIEVASALDVARAKASAAEGRLQRLAMLQDECGADTALQAHPSMVEALGRARQAIVDADQARERVRTASERVRARQLAADHARGALEQFDRRIAERDRTDAALAADRSRLARLRESKTETETRLAGLQATYEAAFLAVEDSRGQLALAHAEASRQEARAALEEIDRRLDAARDATQTIEAAKDRLARNAASEALVVEARRHSSRLAGLDAKAAATTPHAGIIYLPGQAGRIRIDGRVVGDGERLVIERPTELEIDGIGSIFIEPPQGDRASAVSERNACREDLAGELNRIGVADLAAAEALLGVRREDERMLEVARARFAQSVPGGIDALVAQRNLTATRAEGLAIAGLPDRATIEARSRVLEAELAAKRAALARAVDEARGTTEEMARLEATVVAGERRREEIELELPPNGDREAARGEFAEAVEQARAALAEAVREQTAWMEVAPDGAAYDALNLAVRKAAAESAAFEQGRLRRDKEIAELEGALRRDGEDGVGAEIAGLEEELSVADARLADLGLEVRSLEMLRQRLDRVGTTHREQVLRPVVDRLHRLLAALLPGARIVLEGPLLVAQIERSGTIDAMARLSGGTREQIATLVRIAYADLMAARGVGLPLVLDDALVFSDDARLSTMTGLLAAAAKQHQVIVLSCRSSVLQPLLARHDVHRLELTPWLDDDASRARVKMKKGRTSGPASALVQ